MKFVWAAFLILPATAFAQGDTLTLARAVAVAKARGPLAPVAQAQRMIAQGRARADGAFPNPVFEWRRENLSSPISPDIFATVQLPLDITGRRFALRSAGSALLERGRADSSSVARQFEMDIARAYWRAALGRELLAVATTERRAREEIATFDANRAREGAVAEVAAIRTQLETDRARIAEATARGEAARAGADLARLLGIPAESLPALSRLDAARTLATVPDESTAIAQALALRTDLAALRHAAREASHRASAERRGVIPDVQVISGYKQTTGYSTGVLGVLVPIPLFSRNEGARERAAGELQLADAALRDAELRVRGEVLAAFAALDAMRQALSDGTAGLDARAAEVAQIAEGAYREGAISLMELVEAQRARAETRAAALRWSVDLHLAMLDLNRAIGAPLLETP